MRGLPAGETVGPCADAGYYAVVKPLAVGEHVIEIQGTLGELEVDATYEITVSRRAEPRFAAAAAALEHLVAAAARKRAWPRSTPGRSLLVVGVAQTAVCPSRLRDFRDAAELPRV